MRGDGRETRGQDRGMRNIQMVISMKGLTSTGKLTGGEFTNGQMEILMRENGLWG